MKAEQPAASFTSTCLSRDERSSNQSGGEMSPGSSTESYPAFVRIGLRENPGKNLNQVTCPDRDWNPGHLVSQPDALTVTPQNLVAPPRVTITAATPSGMFSTSLCRISTAMRRHSSCNMTLSWTMEVGRISRNLNRRSNSSQRCSMGLRSGLCAGQSSR
ncbi:hypothetical protein ANN_16229 [Periplaneta americana]|uniref:Uncharacterized protein n=1 Tax=Periplaneta americana TaxID=6978 RepID=A0ABQ8SIE4_PERAM|nr:hypothetical protein ANN_16229 [Periplaneta americana]